jgi:hypothetical protein
MARYLAPELLPSQHSSTRSTPAKYSHYDASSYVQNNSSQVTPKTSRPTGRDPNETDFNMSMDTMDYLQRNKLLTGMENNEPSSSASRGTFRMKYEPSVLDLEKIGKLPKLSSPFC